MQYCKSVTLRMRDRRNGTKSLFLDFWPGWKSHSTLTLLATQDYPFWLKYD